MPREEDFSESVFRRVPVLQGPRKACQVLKKSYNLLTLPLLLALSAVKLSTLVSWSKPRPISCQEMSQFPLFYLLLRSRGFLFIVFERIMLNRLICYQKTRKKCTLGPRNGAPPKSQLTQSRSVRFRFSKWHPSAVTRFPQP